MPTMELNWEDLGYDPHDGERKPRATLHHADPRRKGINYFSWPWRHAATDASLAELAREVQVLAPALLRRRPSKCGLNRMMAATAPSGPSRAPFWPGRMISPADLAQRIIIFCRIELRPALSGRRTPAGAPCLTERRRIPGRGFQRRVPRPVHPEFTGWTAPDRQRLAETRPAHPSAPGRPGGRIETDASPENMVPDALFQDVSA